MAKLEIITNMASISTIETTAHKRSPSTKSYVLPKRVIVVILSFLGLFNVLAMRSIMSVVVVAIVNNSHVELGNSFHNYSESSNETYMSPGSGRYNWDSKMQGNIMGSFFYSYFISTICGGYFAVQVGATRMFGGSVLFTALLTLLSPLSIEWGYASLIILRCLIGLFEGFAYPSMMVIISQWAPKSERSRILAVILSGNPFGVVVSSAVAGWLSNTAFLGGWPMVFYVFGSISCFWCIFWFIFIYELPQEHPSITVHELSLYSDTGIKSCKRVNVPWISILKSMPFWAAFAANFGTYFSSVMLLTELPTYFSTVLHFKLTATGFLSTIPHITECCGSYLSAYVADKLRNTEKLHITSIRKIMNSIASYGLAICFIGIALADYRPQLIIILLCVGMLINGCKHSGFIVIHTDMSSHLSGTTFGLCNGISSLTGIMAPAMAGAFTISGATTSNWAKVFYVTAAMESVAATFFVIFASAEIQSWAKIGNSNKQVDKKRNIKGIDLMN